MKNNKFIAIVILLFIIEGILSIFYTPPFEAPDENHHLDYINYFAKNLSLPVQNVKEKAVAGEGHQNPLYYILTGTIVRLLAGSNGINYEISRNPNNSMNGGKVFHTSFFLHNKEIFFSNKDKFLFYLLRFFSLFSGVIAVLFVFRTVKLFSSDIYAFFVSAGFVALLPQFIFINSVINNDALNVAISTISVYYFFSFVREKNLRFLIFAFVSLGFAVLTKYYPFGFLFLYLWQLVLEYSRTKIKSKRKQLIKFSFTSIIFFILIVLPLFARNFLLYNKFLGYDVFLSSGNGLFDLRLSDVARQFVFLLVSFYAKFGWGNVNLPFILYLPFILIIILTTISMLFKYDKIWLERVNKISILGILILFAEVIYYNFFTVQMQGRFLFSGLAFIAIIIHNSFSVLFASSKIKETVAVFIVLSFVAVSVLSIYYRYIFYL